MLALLLALALGISCGSSEPSQESAAPPLPPLEYLGSWGAKGNDPSRLQFPVGITTDAQGSVFILDNPPSLAFVHKYDPQGHPLLTFAVPGSKHPRGIAVDSGGAIYTADATGSVHIFLPDGKPYRTLRSAAGRRLGVVTSVAVDTLGNVYVADASAARIVKFNPRLRFEQSWGSRGSALGELNDPAHLALGQDFALFVLESQNRRVQKFTLDGAAQAAWPFPVPAPPAAPPPASDKDKLVSYGLAVSPKYVALLDAARGHLDFWTLGGEMQQSFSLAARQEIGASAALAAIAWTPRGDLLLLDAASARVLRYRVNF